MKLVCHRTATDRADDIGPRVSRILSSLLLVLLFTSSLTVQTLAQNSPDYHLRVGAFGDAASNENLGVQAEIRTHGYEVRPPEYDGFWVGDVLENGAFIQFGYVIDPPGSYCSYAEVPVSCFGNSQGVNGSEAIWVWQYWPDATGSRYYYRLGGTGSGGSNGTWHSYRISPDSQGDWSFQFDGQEVSRLNFTTVHSAQRIHVVAEKNAGLADFNQSAALGPEKPGPLGPVEFRNLAYLKQDGWHVITMLYAYAPCVHSPICLPNSYGVSLLGPNHIIAGTSVPQPNNGELLWNGGVQSSETSASESATSRGTLFLSNPLVFSAGLGIAVVAILLVIEVVVLPKRKHAKRRR